MSVQECVVFDVQSQAITEDEDAFEISVVMSLQVLTTDMKHEALQPRQDVATDAKGRRDQTNEFQDRLTENSLSLRDEEDEAHDDEQAEPLELMSTFVAGPAAPTRAQSRRGRRSRETVTGTGLAPPKMNPEPLTIRNSGSMIV